MCTLSIDRKACRRNSGVTRSAACDEAGNQRTLMSSDRLRLDVAKSNVEMYSWVGESRFEDRDILRIVRDGAISDGTFVALLNDILRTKEARFTYLGGNTDNGRTTSEFGFKIPREHSQYTFDDGKRHVIVGYEGTFQVDPTSGRLIAACFSNGPALPANQCLLSFDYSGVQAGHDRGCRPSPSSRIGSTRLELRWARIGEPHDLFKLPSVFWGESTISFGPPSEVVHGNLGPPGSALSIPPRISFTVALTQGIDTATAAAGDQVSGTLTTAIRDGRKVIVPKGAAIKGASSRSGNSTALHLTSGLDSAGDRGCGEHLDSPRGNSRQCKSCPEG
jgi:hypothetical protein